MPPLAPPCRCDADPPPSRCDDDEPSDDSDDAPDDWVVGRGGWPWRSGGSLLGGRLRGELRASWRGCAAHPWSEGEGALSSREMMRSW
eukprot:scaffold128197_cov18-Phaeocystis_antarctica.AAC.1